MSRIHVLLAASLLIPSALPAADFSMEVLFRGNQTWNGATVPDYPDGSPEISIVKMTVQPGANLPEHLHPVINGGYVISGELTVWTEHGEETVFHAGDATLEVVNTWHASRNTGDTVTEIIVFYVGTPGVDITERRPAP